MVESKKREKVFVLDTSVILYSHDAILNFQEPETTGIRFGDSDDFMIEIILDMNRSCRASHQ